METELLRVKGGVRDTAGVRLRMGENDPQGQPGGGGTARGSGPEKPVRRVSQESGDELGGTRGSEERGRARGRGAPCPSPAPGPPGSRGDRGKTWAPGLGSVWWSRSRCRPRSAGPSGPHRLPLPALAVRDPVPVAARRRRAGGRARGAWGRPGEGWGARGLGHPRHPARSRHPLPAPPSPGPAAAPPSWAAAATAARAPPGRPISRQGEPGRPIGGGGAGGEGRERPQPAPGDPCRGGAAPALGGGTSGTSLHFYGMTGEARPSPFVLGLAQGGFPVTHFRSLLLWTVGRRGR